MLGIGWVMFVKALVLGVWIIALERWQAFKRKRVENGHPHAD